jgi:hypothetical protein
MLGDTLTYTVGGSGGTAKTLKKIAEQNYSSEYVLFDGSAPVIKFSAKVRHLVETVRPGLLGVNRHIITFRNDWTDATTGFARFRETQLTLRNQDSEVPADMSDCAEALAYWASEANLLKIIGWES